MRFNTFLFAIFFTLSFNCFSQSTVPVLQTKVSLKTNGENLNEILKQLAIRYKVNFSYVNDLIPSEKKIFLHWKDKPLKEVLDELLAQANLDYQQVGNQIVLKKINHEIKEVRAKLYQTIRGIVSDKVSNEVLSGATIYLLGDHGFKATTSGQDGKFRFDKVPLGRYDLKVTFIGYKENTATDIILNSGKEIILNVLMEENIVQGETVTIYAQKDKSSPNNELIISSVTSIKPESISRFAGTRQDPSRAVSSYAGVINGRDPRNDIIVRGNSAYGVLWRLEGVDIPNPNHYSFVANGGGAFSILNHNHLSSSDFITSAFPAEYGNKTSAVMDLKLRNGNNEKMENSIQAGLNGLEFSSEGPIGKKGASYMAGVRVFNFKLLDAIGLNFAETGVPKFSDATFKINVPTSSKGTFSLWGIWGKSFISLKEAGNDTITWGKAKYINEDYLSSNMYAYGFSHTYSYNSRLMGRLNVATSGSDIRYSNKEIHRNDIKKTAYTLQNNEGQNTVNYTLNYIKNHSHQFKAGVTFKHLFYNNYDLVLLPEDSAYISGLDKKGSSFSVQSFANWNFNISQDLELNTGVYYQYFDFNHKWTIEPRLSLRYQIDEKQNVTFGSGIHSQLQPLPYYQYSLPDTIYKTSDYNKKLGFTKSLHLVAGYNYSFNPDWRIKTEIYYQYLYKVPVTLMDGYGSYSALNEGSEYSFSIYDSTVNKGTGKNMGVEITLEKYFSKKYYFITTLSLIDSKYKGADGIERNTTFNIGHIFNVLGGRVFDLDGSKRKQLFFDGKITYAGGRRYVEVDEAKTAADPLGIVHYDLENSFEKKVKDYFRADVKVALNINRPNTSHNLFIAVDNILNTRNESNFDWSQRDGKVRPYYQIGIFPYLGYKIQF